jgi:F0F1-type ATP synthase assembly protein I
MECKPLAGLTSTLRMLLKINIVVTSLAVLTGFYDYYSYANLPAGLDPNETMLPSDVVTGIVGLIQFVLFIILGITFLRWIYRTNKNLSAYSGEQMSFTPGWSIGWYFIPIANLFKPYQAMKELWNVSHKKESADHVILGCWWFFWIVSNFLGRLAFKIAMRAENAEGYILSVVTYIASDGIDVALNVVSLMLVTRIGAAYSRTIVEPAGASNGGSATAPPLSVT